VRCKHDDAEAGTDRVGGGTLVAKVLGASGGRLQWISACAVCAKSGSIEPARLRYTTRLSRKRSSRGLPRALTLSRFDTAEPVRVADWGGASGGC
jgi:hypothetical protein